MGLVARVRRSLATAIAPKTAARSAFAGASFSRLSPDIFRSTLRSAADETRYDLRGLRDRARNLDRNSPFGVRYSQLTAEKVIGDCGIQLRARNLLWDRSALHRAANRAIEAAWRDWSLPEHCDVTGQQTLTETMALAVTEWATDGEILIRLYEGSAFGAYGVQIQVLDPDLLDEKLNMSATPRGTVIRQGVEFDAYGKPLAYHLWTRHPADFESGSPREHVAVPAEQIIHAFIRRRAGQVRGVPHVSAMLNVINSIDAYLDAEVNAAWVAAAKMAALEDLPNGDAAITADRKLDADGNLIPITTDVAPASMLDLRGMGAKLSLWDPQHPTTAAPEFVRMMSHYLSMGYGISYATFTGDLSESNYTSMRAGRLDEDDHWDRFKQFIADHVMRRLYRAWLRNALLQGRLPGITDYDVSRWMRVTWQGVGRWKVDPLKDTQADQLEVSNGWSSPQRKAAERGVDFEDMLEEIAEAKRLVDEHGLTGLVAIGEPPTASPAVDAAEEPDATPEDAPARDHPHMRKIA